MKRSLLTLLIINALFFTFSQNVGAQKPCSSPEASQFDFWIGDWELTWNDTIKGINKITKVLNGCSVADNFYDPVLNYRVQSYSVYNPASKLWQQTWLDNAGGYITLMGKFENGEMTLTTQPRKLPEGKESISRMVYFNINEQKLDWRWESSTDNASTWKTLWLTHYKRKT